MARLSPNEATEQVVHIIYELVDSGVSIDEVVTAAKIRVSATLKRGCQLEHSTCSSPLLPPRESID